MKPDATVPHGTGCEGHHCIVCGCCFPYDPDDEEFALEDETEAQRHTCYGCQKEEET